MKKILLCMSVVLMVGCSTKEESKQSSKVVDTTSPVITFYEDTVTIHVGDEFDPDSVIESVKDDVDGDLPIAMEGAENKACYTVASDVSTLQAGSYTVEVGAIDNAGNESSKQCTVIVEE